MKYAIVKVINSNFFIHAEGYRDNLNAAKVAFHGLCQTLWNAPDVLSATVMIVNEQMNCVEGYREYIHHDPQPVQPEGEGE